MGGAGGVTRWPPGILPVPLLASEDVPGRGGLFGGGCRGTFGGAAGSDRISGIPKPNEYRHVNVNIIDRFQYCN